MDLFNSALGRNITFIRPAYFILSGFIGLPFMKYYYAFLIFVYIISVLGNTFVMAVIYLDYKLRTPKYFAVFNLAFVDLLCNTTLVPKVLDIFLFDHFNISYNDCMTFLYFCYTFLLVQAFNLIVLAYDRLVAIMFPLHYETMVTKKSMFSLIGSFWFIVIISGLIAVGFLTRLSFCQSVVINSYFCDHGQIYRLACNDNFPSYIIAHLFIVLVLWVPFAIILCSYLLIAYALAKVATAHERMKGFKTCTAHLSLVAIYFFPMLITFTIGAKIHPNARIINLSLSSVFPPMLNPIIYVLQTQEIRSSLKKMFKLRSQSRILFN